MATSIEDQIFKSSERHNNKKTSERPKVSYLLCLLGLFKFLSGATCSITPTCLLVETVSKVTLPLGRNRIRVACWRLDIGSYTRNTPEVGKY